MEANERSKSERGENLIAALRRNIVEFACPWIALFTVIVKCENVCAETVRRLSKASDSTSSADGVSGSRFDNDPNRRGYKKFGHTPRETPRITKIFHFVVGSLFILSLLDWPYLKKKLFPPVKADVGQEPKSTERHDSNEKEGDISDSESDSESISLDAEVSKKRNKKEKVGFRERKIIEYENRIRQYSTPDKVFRYFATIQVPSPSGDHYEVFMTPVDFLTSMTPGMKQPEGLGLDQYRRYDPKTVTERLDLHLEKDSIFYKLGSYGLISFSDYIFLLTVLSSEYTIHIINF
ncbi:unnamed protein product [Hermetia illucens]|uniref:Uncharacterized protein n=1 Tax=Hermetia illucens TaxID=343691 RepID=A0A7R8UDV8_HERIL|nr:unnamed protein product [Hermetia illucens]